MFKGKIRPFHEHENIITVAHFVVCWHHNKLCCCLVNFKKERENREAGGAMIVYNIVNDNRNHLDTSEH